MSVITLKNMEFHAYHGCLEHEKQLGNTFIVSLSMKINTEKAGISDQLSDTLNYQEVYDIVRNQMDIPSQLIEHVAERIAQTTMEAFPAIEELSVILEKLNPPLGGKVSAVTIKIDKNRR